jgi:hypothetical protein
MEQKPDFIFRSWLKTLKQQLQTYLRSIFYMLAEELLIHSKNAEYFFTIFITQ